MGFEPAISPSKDNLYFSYWSWHLLKECPMAFKLTVLDRKRPQGPRDVGNAIQGSIPDLMSEHFFGLPPNERDINYFLDKQTFETNWEGFLAKERVDWIRQARRYAKKSDGKFQIPDELNPAQEDHWRKWAHDIKKAETSEHVRNLVRMIVALGIEKKKTQTQVEFRVQIEPSKTQDNEFYPALTVGGRIDLLVEDDQFEDIWDVKAVEKPKDLDQDQLIIYRMARRAQGKIVRTVGFLHCKDYKKHPSVDPRKITDAHEIEIKRQMRVARNYFMRNVWPANWRHYWCPKGYCDVSEFCHVNISKTAGLKELEGLKPGKVDF